MSVIWPFLLNSVRFSPELCNGTRLEVVAVEIIGFFPKEEPAMYEPHYEEEAGGGGFIIGLLCGTALGAAIGLMFAPRAGSEIRQTLLDSTGDIRRKASDAYGQASEQVNNIVSKGRQAVDRGREAFDSARQSASGQGGNGSTTEFGGQSRQGVADFNSGNRTTGAQS
jgi:gas vesicle protein